MQLDWQNLLTAQLGAEAQRSASAIWVYGSGAGGTGVVRDIDVLFVSTAEEKPRRIVSELSNGLPISLNVIGPNSLLAHDQYDNGGFYFSGKLISPIKLIEGDEARGLALAAGALAHMIFPWALYLIDESACDELLSVEQLAALLYLLMIRINYNYVNYFTKWRTSANFPEFWQSVCGLVKASLTPLQSFADVDVMGDEGLVCTIDFPAQHERRIQLEFLKTCHWQTFLDFRQNEPNALAVYYRRQTSNAAELGAQAVQESIEFLYQKVGARLLAVFSA
jgi:hypothetical protein